MKRLVISLLSIVTVLVIGSCTAEQTDYNPASNDGARATTKSFEELGPKDFFVSNEDLIDYIYYKSSGQDWNWYTNENGSQICFDPAKDVTVIPYPDKNNPSIYIVNYKNCWNIHFNEDFTSVGDQFLFSRYPDCWEIISSDKRTAMVLAAGEGTFSMDDCNANLIGWIKDMAAEIAYLHTYSGDIKNAKERYAIWCNIIEAAVVIEDRWENDKGVYPFTYPDYLKEHHLWKDDTRSSTQIDTTYHPIPGHYELIGLPNILFQQTQGNHLTTTQWGEGSPYNQYCPKYRDIPTMRAKAGSEAVAGGQLVHYMHYFSDACPQIYGSAFCNAYIEEPMDWDAIGQFDKSEANWANFQTSDSTRTASVLLANIGTGMRIEYGLNCTSGATDDLQRVLADEYGLESYCIAFDDEDINPYNEIKDMIDNGIPSIVHSAGSEQNNTDPYTFLIDGYHNSTYTQIKVYVFVPETYDPQYEPIIATVETLVPCPYFGMNWGDYGNGNDIWFADSQDWHVASGDHSNRQALISFR